MPATVTKLKKSIKGLQIEHLPTSGLVPYPNNPKSHPDAQISKIAGSIKEFGFVVPILLDEGNGIIAGHGRLEAAKVLKMDTVPCVRAEGLTEAQKKAYRIADNQLQMSSGWLDDTLSLELEGLKELDFDLDLLGFDDIVMEDYSDLDGINSGLDGNEDNTISITVPEMHIDEVTEWLANGETKTGPGMGKGVLKRCGLL